MQTQYHPCPVTWKVTQREAWKDIANLRIKLFNNFTKSQRHAWNTINLKKIKSISGRTFHSLLTNCSKCPYFSRIGKPDILLSANKVAREVTTWTKSCDKPLACLMSYIHHTKEYWQCCYMGNTAQRCRLWFFQNSDFSGDFEDSKSPSGGVLCIFGRHTFVPTSWMCKKQTSVSQSFTEAEIISFDAGLRMDGIPALTFCDLVIELMHFVQNRTEGPEKSHGNSVDSSQSKHAQHHRNQKHRRHSNEHWSHSIKFHEFWFWFYVFFVFEDNEGAIKMIIKGRSFTMRHVSRIHWIPLDWLFDRFSLGTKSNPLHWHQTPTRRHVD